MLITTLSVLLNTVASFTTQDNILYAIQPIKAAKFVTEITSHLISIHVTRKNTEMVFLSSSSSSILVFFPFYFPLTD